MFVQFQSDMCYLVEKRNLERHWVLGICVLNLFYDSVQMLPNIVTLL
jgi:hypothetical protein